MSSPFVPFIPDSAPFTPEQRAWLNGYLAGLFSRAAAPSEISNQKSQIAAPAAPLTILFGSQTGTGENLAKKAAKLAATRGFAPSILDAASADVPRLASSGALLVITSTYGDGEPPDNAKALLSSLRSLNGAQLTNVRFSVCGLGDTNYAKFCQCAKDFDAALARLGATRVNDRVDCDLDYDGPFQSWLEKSLSSLSAAANSGAIASVAPIENPKSKIENSDAEPRFSKKNPFAAPILAVRCLNAAGSAKEVNHVEFSLGDSDLAYEAGDALGVYPQHCPQLVNDVITALGCDGEESVPAPSGSPTSLRRALTDLYDLGRPAPALIELLALNTEKHGQPHDVLDALRLAFPSKRPSPDVFVGALKKLQPRLYSISSSPRAHAGQVHLTVGAVRYELGGRARKGVCSTFLAERALAIGRAGVFVHRNPNFRLPATGDTPVIMVGPGTGIAPFRAFLAERRATGAKGRNWLFFGDQKSSTDFLYREELEDLQRDGTLTRLDLAWSRDAATKTYVQHRMLEHATELFAWLEAGANFYVCGDASRMARDVDEALVQAVACASGRTADKAADYVAQLKSARRYQRDVY